MSKLVSVKKRFYVVYESYQEYNQFEGTWDLETIEFKSFEEADRWMRTSEEAKQCNYYDRKLIGPLALVRKRSAP